MNCKLSKEMARSITESRKILERLQKQLITRVIERGSSVKKKKKYPFLPRYGDHMIERNSRLQGVGLSMISVTRCHICVIKQTSTLAHGLWPVLS